jgi:hypothetical protein
MAENKPTADKPTRRKMGFMRKLMLIVFSLVAMAVLRSGFIFFLIGMLPSVVIYYLDQSEQRYAFRTILYCNLAGMLPYVGKMLRYGPTSGVLNDIMGTASTWLIVYGSALMGGILISLTPMIAGVMIGRLHQTQINRLVRNQKRIEQEWGKEVTQFGVQSETA